MYNAGTSAQVGEITGARNFITYCYSASLMPKVFTENGGRS